jgi:hypothetical protein
MKECPKCQTQKDLCEYGRDKQKKDGLNTYCKACIRGRSAKQRELHSEYANIYAGEYRRINRELLRKKSYINYYVNWEKRAEQSKRSYEKHKEKIAKQRAEKSREAVEQEKNRKRQAEWRANNKTRVGKTVARWKKKNPHKAACHTLILWALRTGVIKKPEACEECSAIGKVEAHHTDYLKPLDVIWVCKGCHSKKHRIYR